MKKTKVLVFGMTLAMLLSGCGETEAAPNVYKLSFHQESVAEDVVISVTEGVTKNEDITEPAIQNKVDGYNYTWEEYDVTSMKADLVVNVVKTPITYVATYYDASGEEYAKREFTVEDTSVPNEPEAPGKRGYIPAWEDYTISAKNMNIYPEYKTLKEYTATFKIDGEVFKTMTFTIENLDQNDNLTLDPTIPDTAKRDYYDARWETVDLSELKDCVVNLVYTPHEYVIKYKDGENVVATRKYTYINGTASEIVDPEVPVRDGYEGVWSYTADASSQEIIATPVYDTITYYATFVDENGAQVGEPVAYTVETKSITEPEVPAKNGWDGSWNEYTFDVGGITVTPNYVLHRHYIDYLDEDGEIIETIYYDGETEDYASLQKPAVPTKTGYDGVWDDNGLELTWSETHMTVSPTYTAKTFTVTFPGDEDEVENVTYGQEYDFTSRGSYWKTLFNGDTIMPLSGIFTFTENIILTETSNRNGFEDFENVGSLNGLIDKYSSYITGIEVKDGVGVNGSKGLEISYKESGEGGVYFSKEYLDLAFANEEVKALEFDAKANVTGNNFRHQTFQMPHPSDKTKPLGAYNYTYFENIAGKGIATYWQRFSLSRSFYEDFRDNSSDGGGYVLWFTLPGGTKLWVDNLRPSLKDDASEEGIAAINFDNLSSSAINYGVNDIVIKSVYAASDATNKTDTLMKIFTEGAHTDVVDLSTTIKSQGLSSLHFHKTSDSYTALYINKGLRKYAVENGYDALSFDMLATNQITEANINFYNSYSSGGSDSSPASSFKSTFFKSCRNLAANKWQTFVLPLENLRNASNDDGLLVLSGSSGKAENDIYIDNIHPVKTTGSRVFGDFEDAKIFKLENLKQDGSLDGYMYEPGYNYTYGDDEYPINQPNLRDWALTDLCINGVLNLSEVKVDDTHASSGRYSLKMVVEKEGRIYINGSSNGSNHTIKSLPAGTTIKYDFFNGTNETVKFGERVNNGIRDGVDCAPNQWTTITITKDGDEVGFHRLSESSLPVGEYWVDNFRIIAAE